MSKYTTGELAKRFGVTVRTVQYYDTRGILVPSELSEGGRRLYSEEDLKRMQIICFLRSLGLSIDAIAQLLSEDDPGSVISLLLEQQEAALREEVSERQEKLKKLEELRRGLKSVEELSVESIGDIASTMSGKNKLRDLRRDLLLAGVPISVLQWTSIVLWIVRGWWWLFVIWAVLAIPAAATGPALIIVGVMMCSNVTKVDWNDFTEAIPAFFTMLLMPMCYSISDGIMLGIVMYVLMNICIGKKGLEKISPTMSVLAIIFVLRYWQKSSMNDIVGGIFVIIILMSICGSIGYQIGKNRKLGGGWSFALGAIPVVGWIIAACSKKA